MYGEGEMNMQLAILLTVVDSMFQRMIPLVIAGLGATEKLLIILVALMWMLRIVIPVLVVFFVYRWWKKKNNKTE